MLRLGQQQQQQQQQHVPHVGITVLVTLTPQVLSMQRGTSHLSLTMSCMLPSSSYSTPGGVGVVGWLGHSALDLTARATTGAPFLGSCCVDGLLFRRRILGPSERRHEARSRA